MIIITPEQADGIAAGIVALSYLIVIVYFIYWILTTPAEGE